MFNCLKILIMSALVLSISPDASASCFAAPDAPITYDEIADEALFNCRNKIPTDAISRIIEILIEVEKRFDPPPELRGMVLAAACMESGFNPKAKGDRKFSRSGRKPMAIGILQMWSIYEKIFPGIDRTDPASAANGWMTHIVNRIPYVKRRCRYATPEKTWIAAWVTGIRAKKKGGRCKEKPLHLRLLRKWHKKIRNDRQRCWNMTPDGIDGC